jgi:hypothetical protein
MPPLQPTFIADSLSVIIRARGIILGFAFHCKWIVCYFYGMAEGRFFNNKPFRTKRLGHRHEAFASTQQIKGPRPTRSRGLPGALRRRGVRYPKCL